MTKKNYLTGGGPTVTCEYCGTKFHAEATGCPNPRCAAHAGATEFDRWRSNRLLLTLRKHVTGAVEKGKVTAIVEQPGPDKYYVSIKTAKGSEIRLSSGPLTLEQALQVEQELNSRLIREPFACKGKWPAESGEQG